MTYLEIVFKIVGNKEKLKEEDYKVIKCYEAQLLGEEMPYDIVVLINQRKQMRLELEDLEKRKLALEVAGKGGDDAE
jgi:hypothetical protein